MKIRKGSNEEWLFNLFRVKANPDTNIVKYDAIESGNKDKFYKGIAILKQQGLIAKISNGIYLVNPNILKPFHPNYQPVLKHWLEVTNKNH